MTALDRRWLRHAPAVRGFIGLAATIGGGTALLVITQAGLLADVIARAFLGGAGLGELTPPLVLLIAVVLGRAALAWAGGVAAHRAAASVVAQLRARLLRCPRRLRCHPPLSARRSPLQNC